MNASGMIAGFAGTVAGLLPVDRLFDGVADIVFFIKDAAGRYVAVNDTLAARCGLAGKDLALGRRAEDLFPPPLGEAFARQDRAILAGARGIRDHLELHLYPGGRSGWCLTYKEPIPAKRGGLAGLLGISRDLHLPGAADGGLGPLAAAIRHIHAHFDQPLRLKELADIAGLSTYQFDQRIRALFRVSAGQYLVKTRIDAARARLAEGDDPVARIALDCGYSDQSAFSRQFKQVTGISPAAYRRRLARGG
jgi:AraC-like DNA-binding protein